MSLKKYLSKRNLAKSSEPSGGEHPKGVLNFCVQEHHARRLHWDFRLEYRGVLLSWAVPKGPSMNPSDKRLAIQVEDHPLDYQYFEGVIPEGNYGAGTVKIWDHGTYSIPQIQTRKKTEEALAKGLKEGHFAILLAGEKLKGEFVFLKLKNSSKENEWLLIKKGDSFAGSSNDETASQATLPPLPKKSSKKKVKMPDFISPMLATLVKEPFSDKEWVFEIKWDGFRSLAFVNHHDVQLKSRNRLSLNQKFPSIAEQLKKIPHQVILDGELVILDAEGKSSFQLMQNYQREGKGNLFYYAFDLLFIDGVDLRNQPLLTRKEYLRYLLEHNPLPSVRFSDHFPTEGKRLYKEAVKKHLEGIIGKKISSTYQSKRSRDWVKIKTILRQEVVIGGFTAPKGSRKKFGALIVGVFNAKRELQYAGHVGGGFTASLLKDIYEKLEPLIQKQCPFKSTPKGNAPATWVKPLLVCEVSFTEWTEGNQMRHPVFQGLRIDKPAKTVKKEVPKA